MLLWVPHFAALPKITGALNCENPREMDDILGALGADVIDWGYNT